MVDGENSTWIIPFLASGKSHNVTVSLKAVNNGTWTNIVNVTCAENSTFSTNNTTVVVNPPIANMTVNVTANDNAVYPGNQTSFTIVVTNTGEVELNNISVVNNLPLELIYDSFIGNNWTYVDGKFIYNGSLSVGESANFTIIVNTTKAGNYTNIATASSDSTDNVSDNDSVRVYNPSLTVEELTNDPIVIIGNSVSFTIVVTNDGDCDLDGVYVDNTIPDGLNYLKYLGPKWSKVGNRYIYQDVLKAGESVNFTIYYNTTKLGDLINEVAAGSSQTESVQANITAENDTYVIKLNPGMSVVKVANSNSVKVGQIISFTITVINTGDCNLGGIYVIENIPAGLKYIRFDGNGWSKNGNIFTYDGILAPGENVSFTIYFMALKTGNFTNSITAGSNMTGNVSSSVEFEVLNKTNKTNKTTPVNPKKSVKPIRMHETGNPIVLLLLVIIAIIPLKRRKH